MTTSTFEPLSRLFRGDAGRIRRVLEIFERVTREDLRQLDTACAAGDWATVGMLAHKMKAGCMQLGEVAAAEGLASVERALSGGRASDATVMELATLRDELDRVMTRVASYLASRDE